jgi:hypothetical protein
MRFSSLLSPKSRGQPQIKKSWVILSSLVRLSHAISFNTVPSPNLDLSPLGRVGIAGDFDGISLYQFQGQNENSFASNGSQSVLARYPDGGFASIVSSDAGIQAMCPFMLMDGSMAGVIVAGNFTSLGGMESQGIAMFNPNNSNVTPLPGLSGQVSALFCDQSTSTVYVGGSFKGANSTNAIAWVGTEGWTNLPFLGFNGPVTSITKSSAGKIIFGGSFTGLGNASTLIDLDQQVINISGAKISSGSSTTTAGFSDPKNIVCKTSGIDGPGNTWLLADQTPGFWRADFGFGFQPTKLRLRNTHQDGRGIKTWRYTASPINGIMNFTYIDPATGQNSSCTSECPLSNDPAVPFQDFVFVNVIGMNAFQIDVSDWYGKGGGLNGIELFQNDIYSYAIDEFNEPSCVSNSAISSKATVTGPWVVTPSHDSVSEYLTASISDASSDLQDSVVFLPHIKQPGNYSVNMYTPGCIQDSSCGSRGRVNITGIMGSGTNSASFKKEIYQTNNFDKYDQIYFGFIEAASDSFRPSVTISRSSGQSGNLTIVAQRVGFTLIDSAGGLNSLFEYDPTKTTVNTSDFSVSVVDKAGLELGQAAGVNVLATSGDTTYVGGNYSTGEYDNVFAINKTTSFPLTGGGLNGEVLAMYLNDTKLYLGGNFTSTSKIVTSGLGGVALYDTSTKSWSPLGAGVSGRVLEIVPLSFNVSGNIPETVISLTGNFGEINAFGNKSAISVSGFAIWVPSRGNWLQNLGSSTASVSGQLSASVDLPDGSSFFAGSVAYSQLGAHGVATLSSGLGTFPINIQQPQAKPSTALSKRATSSQNSTLSQNVTGIVTGHFYEVDGRNITVLGGHFTATATDGSTIHNLAFIDGTKSDTVTGVGSALSDDSTVLALAVSGDTLYAGGTLAGNVQNVNISGLFTYNLKDASFPIQPPALSGDSVAVYGITVRPSNNDVYVGGSFKRAGSLECPGLCVFSSSAQWNRPGTIFSGIVNTFTWQSADSLLVGGSLNVGGNSTVLASYNTQTQVWTEFQDVTGVPGPVFALAPASSDVSQFWVAGVATNGSSSGSTFLMKYDGSKWNSVGDNLGPGTTIRDLQIIPLTQGHDSSSLLSSNEALLITGSLNLPGFGNASAVLFNGTTFQPFALTSSSGDSAGSISQIFSQQQFTFQSASTYNIFLATFGSC